MLDSSYNAKLGDFRLARLGDHGTGPQTTDLVKGTMGYIDPEFVNTHHRSTESDINSFGVVLLEIVSGQWTARIHLSRCSSRYRPCTARPSAVSWMPLTRGCGETKLTTSRWSALCSWGSGARTVTPGSAHPSRRPCRSCSPRSGSCQHSRYTYTASWRRHHLLASLPRRASTLVSAPSLAASARRRPLAGRQARRRNRLPVYQSYHPILRGSNYYCLVLFKLWTNSCLSLLSVRILHVL